MQEGYTHINLPSRCLTYDNVKPEEIGIRDILVRDEKIVTSSNYANLEKKFLVLLERVTIGLDINSLTLGDRMYLTVWLAVNSQDKNYDMSFDCGMCGQAMKLTVDLSERDVVKLSKDFKQPYPVTLSNGDTVNLRLFTVKDEVAIANYEEQLRTVIKNPNTDLENEGDVWTYRYALSIVDDDKNIIDKQKYIEGLKTSDFAKIRVFQEKFYHGMDFSIKYICPVCRKGGTVELPFSMQLLFPSSDRLLAKYGDAI